MKETRSELGDHHVRECMEVMEVLYTFIRPLSLSEILTKS
jgi:hypothetical protein